MPITGTELSTISTDTSAGSGDHGMIVLLNISGKVDPSMLDSSGTITAVVAGTAMSGGGSSGSVTLNVTLGTSGSSAAAGNDSRLSDSRAPNGTAGGDLAGSYPNPTVAKIHETSGPTALTIGAVGDGQFLSRSGSTVIGVDGGATGTSWFWYSSSETISDGDGIDGDFAIVVGGPTGNGNIYQKLTGHWTAVGNIKGTAGAAGTIIRSGTTAPVDATGADGDFYMRTDTGQFYKRVSGTYTLVLTMQLALTYSTGLDLTSNTLTVVYAPALKSATTTVNVASATAPSSGQVLTATDSTHATWQAPSGGVSLTSSAPANVTAATAAVGTGTAAARDDHKHNITVAGPSTLVVGGSNTSGSAASLALSDHVHSLPAFGTASGTFMQGNQAAGGDSSGTLDALVNAQARGLKSASTTVSVSAATAPSTGQVLTATDSTHATWQAPAGGAPSGSAGGDLGSTYPNPTVVQARGLLSATTTVSVSGATAPSSGQVLTATSSTAATWQAAAGGAPTGSAGGDLSGTYPNPSVVLAPALKSATTTVNVSSATAPSSGQVLTATSSTAATWQAAAGGAPTGSAGGDLGGTYPNPTVSTSAALKSATTNVVTSSATAPTSGQVLTATSSTAAAWSTPTTGASNPFIDAPASPHADNDEFTSWSGWTVYDATAASALTDDGDGSVDPWSYPATGHYRRKTVGTYILLQFPKSTNNVVVYKAITPASNMLVWSRWASGANFDSNGVNSFQTVMFGVFQDNGSGRPKIATDGFTVAGISNPSSNTGRNLVTVQQGGTQLTGQNVTSSAAVPDIFAVFEISTTSRVTFFVDSRTGDFFADNGGPWTATRTTVYAGWRIVPSASGAATNGPCPILSIDYFRRKDSATAWVI